mgnify:CR=1 FL=1
MDGNDLGMIARVFMFLLKGLKYVLKLVWFTGLWWFCVPLVVGIGYEEITGTFIQNNQIMDGIFTILWYACYVLCPLNFLQNIIRMVKKDRKFSFLELLLHNRQKKGFEAKLGGDTVALKTAKDLSGVVFGNPHAHIMLTIRPIEKDGTWGAKAVNEYVLNKNGERILQKIDKQNRKIYKRVKKDTTDWNTKEFLQNTRSDWAAKVNTELELSLIHI